MAEQEKACGAPCGQCRNCNPITSMAERVDAYKSAQAMLKDIQWPEDAGPTPHETLVLANWLYYGGGEDDDD